MPADGYGASADLGLGDMLGQQVANETEEQRKKRIAEARQRSLLGPAASVLGGTGLASATLGFGGGFGKG